jgi:hypothetical protein
VQLLGRDGTGEMDDPGVAGQQQQQLVRSCLDEQAVCLVDDRIVGVTVVDRNENRDPEVQLAVRWLVVGGGLWFGPMA